MHVAGVVALRKRSESCRLDNETLNAAAEEQVEKQAKAGVKNRTKQRDNGKWYVR